MVVARFFRYINPIFRNNLDKSPHERAAQACATVATGLEVLLFAFLAVSHAEFGEVYDEKDWDSQAPHCEDEPASRGDLESLCLAHKTKVQWVVCQIRLEIESTNVQLQAVAVPTSVPATGSRWCACLDRRRCDAESSDDVPPESCTFQASVSIGLSLLVLWSTFSAKKMPDCQRAR